MPAGRRCDYPAPKPAPLDATQRLAESLQCGDMIKNQRSLLLRFDRPSDTARAFDVLRAVRDGYVPPRG
jgi:hypothetical protein